MNLFKYHTNPESLHGHDKRDTYKPLIKEKLAQLNLHNPDSIQRALNKTEMKIIISDGDLSFDYAYLTKTRFPEGEPAILKSVDAAYDYWSMILNPDAGKSVNGTMVTTSLADRWPKAEKLFLTSAWHAANYAILIGERWPEAEPLIAKHPGASIPYVQNILKKKWPETEEYIAKDMWQTGRYNMILKDLRYGEEDFIK